MYFLSSASTTTTRPGAELMLRQPAGEPALPSAERSRARTIRARENDRGASAVEYALLIAGIAAVIIVSVAFVGKTVSGQFSKVGSSIAETK